VADRPAYLTALGDAAASGEARSVEFRVRRDGVGANGVPTVEFVWIEMRCRPLDHALQAGGSDNHEIVAVSRDITGRKQQQQDLEEARAEAERANAAKSRFLATMSHELRTPLNAIIGFSDMLKKEDVLRLDAARRQEYAGLINDSGNHLLAVVNGILDMSKIETGNFEITPEPFKPAQAVTSCCDMLVLRARDAGVTLEKVVGDNLPDIVADKRALNQILLNLISNAIRFTDRGGKVMVSARAEAATMTFVVEDNGVGISEEDLARVGEPYFQAESSYVRRHGGTGLGLSIVKGLVRLHGGDISIRSRIGEGTRITVCLPLDCERAQPNKPQRVETIVTALNAVSQAANKAVALRVEQGARRDLSGRDDKAVKKSA
jgi:two-component system, cell cycle sensor histidine kinase DivJ